MTQGSLADKILLYTIPIICTSVLQQLFNAADIAVIGRFVGKEAMAAVGSNSPIISLIINLFVGIALGSNVVIAHATGMKDTNAIQKAVHNSIILAFCGGVIALIAGQLLAGPVLHLTGVPDEVFDMAVLYILSLVQEVGSGYLRGFGMSLVPAMVSLVCICGLRLFWIFAIFPHWPSFRTIMLIYPISLWTTGIIILLMILIIRPSRKLEKEAAVI